MSEINQISDETNERNFIENIDALEKVLNAASTATGFNLNMEIDRENPEIRLGNGLISIHPQTFFHTGLEGVEQYPGFGVTEFDTVPASRMNPEEVVDSEVAGARVVETIAQIAIQKLFEIELAACFNAIGEQAYFESLKDEEEI